MNNLKSICFFALITACMICGCAADDVRPRNVDDDGENDSGASQGADADSDTDTDTDADTDSDSDSDSDDEVCEEQPFKIERDAGRLMILQDLSFSMLMANKWDHARTALTSLLENPAFASIEFGFDRFPDNGDCGHLQLQLDCGPDNQDDIINALPGFEPDGATPIYCAMNNYTNANWAPGFQQQDKARFLLVVSDGEPVCARECQGMSGTPVSQSDLAAVTKALLNDRDIKTLVIGFGYEDDPTYLDAIASNGGTSFDHYIKADDQAQLESALEDVAGSIVSCIFEIQAEDPSSDPDKVNFYFDDEDDAIPRDDGCAQDSGWKWVDASHTAVEFCTESCDRLKSGKVSEVRATFGCKTVVIE